MIYQFDSKQFGSVLKVLKFDFVWFFYIFFNVTNNNNLVKNIVRFEIINFDFFINKLWFGFET